MPRLYSPRREPSPSHSPSLHEDSDHTVTPEDSDEDLSNLSSEFEDIELKEDSQKCEEKMEKDVKEVLHKVRRQRGARKKLFLRGRVFLLGSLDHFQHAYLGITPAFMSKYVEFYDYPEVMYEDAPESYRPPPGEEPEIVGHVHMHEELASQFRGPAPPARCGLGEFTVEDLDSEHDLVFQFLDNHHLIMKMPRELVFASHPREMPASAPKTFVFYGVEDEWVAGRRGSG